MSIHGHVKKCHRRLRNSGLTVLRSTRLEPQLGIIVQTSDDSMNSSTRRHRRPTALSTARRRVAPTPEKGALALDEMIELASQRGIGVG